MKFHRQIGEVSDAQLPETLGGIGGTGAGFNLYRPYNVQLIIDFVTGWKQLDMAERNKILVDPWAFKTSLEPVLGQGRTAANSVPAWVRGFRRCRSTSSTVSTGRAPRATYLRAHSCSSTRLRSRKTLRPCSSASRACILAPEVLPASMTTEPWLRPLMTTLRRGNM